MPFVILPTNSASGGYDITNSLRFNSGSSDKLTRTTGTPTSQQKFTCSAWCKRTNVGTFNIIQSFYTDANNYLAFDFLTSDRLDVINYAGATTARKITTAVFRDVSAWYHIFVSVDTTLATANDRIKIYVNGTLQTAFDTNTAPSQNANLLTNATTTAIGVGEGGSIGYHNGYISEIYYIDGQALDVTLFGETDEDTGIWKPKAYTGTYGTKGYYLQFKNSASLGTDSSGNGNTFTVNNLTSVDQSTDTPTNNFCILNSLYKGSTTPNITEGNLKATNSGVADYQGASGTIPASTTGKWYWEFKAGSGVNGSTTETVFGAVRETRLSATSNQSAEFTADGITAYGSSFSITSGDIIGVTVDRTSAELKIYKNNSLIVTKTSLFNEPLFPYIAMYGSGINIECNFGNPTYSANSYTDGAGYGNFSYAVPSGYYSLNTRNLAQFG